MIKRDELLKIGHFNKPHGIKGEISFSFTDDVFEESECKFFICELNGIFIPFEIENCRFTSDTSAFVKLKNIDSEIKIKPFSHLDVYFPKKYILQQESSSSEINSWDYFIGYTMEDEISGNIGVITDVDETTINTLFIVENNGEEFLIPAVSEFILGIDSEQKILQVRLPEGLI